MAQLGLDNILSESDIDNLFTEEETNDETQQEEQQENENPDEKQGKQKETQETTEVNPDTLFDEEPESVGSEEHKGKEDTNSNKGGSSPYIYSSIAKALREEGVFPDLEDDVVNGIKEPSDFVDMFNKQVEAKLSEQQRRVIEALNGNVETNTIRQYENTIDYLNKIDDSHISANDKDGETLRRQLIYQDYINKGFKPERATKAVDRAFQNGTDIEDAKDALTSNKDFFTEQYNDILQEAKEKQENAVKERKAQAEKLKTSILSDNKVFGDLSIDKSTRQRVYDNITKPIYKDPDTGAYMTALQKYESEHKEEFLKNFGLVYTLTEGFTKMDGLVKNKVKKEVGKGMKELEHVLNNSRNSFDGGLRLASGVDVGDSESFFHGFDLDV